MNDPEIKAIEEVTKALEELTEEQRRNVLLYVNARYKGQAPARGAVTEDEGGQPATFDSIEEFFDAVDPQTEADRVLAVAYWVQVVEGATDFESLPVNRQLKQMGQDVSNITRALHSMINQKPRLVIQTSKTGSSKQARKRYKVTREGIKRIRAMLAQTNGGDNGN
jgi:hypothetical protein